MRKCSIRHIFIILTVTLTACSTGPEGKIVADERDSLKVDTTTGLHNAVANDNNRTEDTINYDNAISFVVVADTSSDYYFLHKKMCQLSQQFGIPIDTMGRFYNKTKNLIALPDNSEDEMYAGNYFERTFPSHNLSLEYLPYYQRPAGEKTIALVTGIYEKEKSADSAIMVLKKTERKVFKIKVDFYVGCLN